MSQEKLSRRNFIKKAGAAVALSSFFTARDMFAQGSPNSKINVGVIGLGKQVGGHIWGVVSDSRCNLSAICDVDDERLQYYKKRIEDKYAQNGKSNTVKTYKDFRDLIADKSIDAVFIVTPDHWHTIMSVLAARAGKHVYCEKPLTFSVQEGRQIIDAVNANGVVFQTGSQQRSEAAFRNAVQLARTGMLGDIKCVYCNVPWRFPTVYNWPAEDLPKGIDWDMWIGPAPMRAYSDHLLARLRKHPKGAYDYDWGEWRWHSDYGNGMQADWGAHHFDIAQWGLDMDGKGPKYIDVYEAKNPAFPNDTKSISYEYENGVKVYYGSPSILQKMGFNKPSAMVTFIGSEGVSCASRGGVFWASKPSLMNAKLPRGKDAAYVSNDHRGNFIDGILYGRPVLCPAEVGVSSCNMCLVGNIAHKLGRRLEWDWKTCSFKNDSAANEYLWRKNRGEWANVI